MACPRAGDREALDSSRHRMTAGFRSEGRRQRGILLQGGGGLGGAWEVRAVLLLWSGWALPVGQILGTPQAFCCFGSWQAWGSSFQSGLVCNAPGRGASLCPAENSDRGASPCPTSRLPGEGLTVAGRL